MRQTTLPLRQTTESLLNSVFETRTAAGKGVDLTGLLGDIKEDWGSEDEVPQKIKLFCETTHNICIKIQQTTVVGVTG